MERIVVGVDGSDCARKALGEAIREAQMRRAHLRVVCAWQLPLPAYGMGGFAPALDEETIARLRESAQQIIDESLEQAKRAEPGVACDGEVVEGQAASVILKEAEHAAMVVIGNRGHGGFGSLLLGSVSHQVVHYAHCPVLVVRAAATS
jgi:nucleotide-binding universal stress UspA family protein